METVQEMSALKEGEVKLFSYFRSSSSQRVRIALNLKGISYQTIGVHLLGSQQSSAEYTQHNPSGLVPALWIDNTMLCESIPILEYLEETRPENPLLPKSPVDRCEVRRLCEHINGNMQPLQNLRLMKKVHEDFGADKMAWAKHWNEVGLKSLEEMLKKTSGKYSFGDSVTLADLCIWPQAIGAFARFGIKEEDYPTISGVLTNLRLLKEFTDGLPENQPDFEGPPPAPKA